MSTQDISNLKSRGAKVFGSDERDTAQSAKFLILLLDCIEKWAQQYPVDELNG